MKTYTVSVSGTKEAGAVITVEAKDADEAEDKAMSQVSELDWDDWGIGYEAQSAEVIG